MVTACIERVTPGSHLVTAAGSTSKPASDCRTRPVRGRTLSPETKEVEIAGKFRTVSSQVSMRRES
jgi:hypothetical protein